MSCPPAVTDPVVGVTMPQTTLMRLVLPAPVGPSSAKISSFTISRSTFFSAWRPEAYVLVRLEIARIGAMKGTIVPSPSGGWRETSHSELRRGKPVTAGYPPRNPNGADMKERLIPGLAILALAATLPACHPRDTAYNNSGASNTPSSTSTTTVTTPSTPSTSSDTSSPASTTPPATTASAPNDSSTPSTSSTTPPSGTSTTTTRPWPTRNDSNMPRKG